MLRVLYFLIAITYGINCTFCCSAYSAESNIFMTLDTGGHTSSVQSLAVSSDKRYLISAGADKTIRVWDVRGEKEPRLILGQIGGGRNGSINALSLSPDDKYLAVGGVFEGNAVKIYDFSSGTQVHTLYSHKSWITSVRFSSDGKFLISGSNDKTVKVWDVLNNFKLLYTFNNHAANVQSVGIVQHDNDYLIISSGLDRRINIVSMKLQKLVATRTFDRLINYLSFSDRFIAASSPDHPEILILDYNLDLVTTIKRKELYALKTAFSPDGRYLLTGKGVKDKWECMVFDAKNNFGRVTSFARHKGTHVYGVTFLDNNTAVTAGGDDMSIYAWDIKTGKVIWENKGKAKDIGSVSMSGKNIAFSFDIRSKFDRGKPQEKIFNLENMTVTNADDSNISFPVLPLEWNDYSLVVDGSTESDNDFKDSTLKIIHKELGERASIIRKNPETRHYVYGFTKDGKIISGGSNGNLKAYNLQGKELAKFVGHTYHVRSLAIDGELLVSGSEDKTIKLWNLKELSESINDKSGIIKSKVIKPILSLFVTTDNEWVIWTEEGFFTASQNGAKYVGYHINQGPDKEAYFIPLNNLYDVFYRPDIIQAKLNGKDISSLITLTAEEALGTPPPRVKFSALPDKTSATKIKVCYEVKSTGGGIGEVRLFQNGKLIKSDGFYRQTASKSAEKVKIANLNSREIYRDLRGLVVREKNSTNAAIAKPKGELLEECVEIEPIAGENEISLAAFNAYNTVQGFMETATFTSTRDAEEPHLYILSVGIDTYSDPSINLKYAAKDAKDFINRLPEKARSIYKSENIHLVALSNLEANKQNILKVIDELSTKIKHGDSFIFFNASHGVLLQNQYYIVTSNFNGDLDSADALIGSNEIVEISKRIKSLSQLYIFDTCHAGGVDNIISGLYDARMVNLARKMGLHIYASAGSVQAAMDGYEGNGLYTHTLLEGIANGKDVDKEKSGNVTVKKLGFFSKEKTIEISTKLGRPQTPFIIDFGRDNPLFTVR